MLTNYLKIAVRNLLNNKLFSLLNLTGLTIGLAVSSFIGMYVWHEFHYDEFQLLTDRTYRINSVGKIGDQEVNFPNFHQTYGSEIKRQVPEVEKVMRYSAGLRNGVMLQTDADHRLKEDKIGYADDQALKIMGCHMLHGDIETALSDPGKIVMTRPFAEKYFGNGNPLGKTIIFDKKYPLTVSAVVEDLPTNSVFQFDALISLPSMSALGDYEKNSYERSGFLETYLVLSPTASIITVEKKLEKIKKGIRFVSLTDRHYLEKLSSLHLGGKNSSGDAAKQLYIFLTIAVLILVLAVINYVSLTTARATKRAREVGVRKAIGSRRGELVIQFFAESLLSTTISFILAAVLLRLTFSWCQQLFDLQMDGRVLQDKLYWILIFGLWVICSLLSGLYPALLLSGFKPQEVLKGSFGSGRSGALVRQVFTTFQFTAAVGLLICCVVLITQMRFLRTKNIGIDRSQVLAIKIDADESSRFSVIRDEVRAWAGAGNVATTQTAMFTDRIMTYFLTTQKTKKDLMVKTMIVDRSFMQMMGVKWVSKPEGWDENARGGEITVYNQTLLKEAGINKYDQTENSRPFKEFKNDGVFRDFEVQSLHGGTPPMMLTVASDTSRELFGNGAFLLVRLNAHSDVSKSLNELKAIYNKNQPSVPFDYYFLDEAYNRLYAKEERMSRLFNGFAGLTVLVACLGLLGFITFSVEVREKEIGVRKVLGASVKSVVFLLSKDFVKLMVLAILIASPVAYYFMNKWLQNFAHKIEISWWMFALSGLSAVVIALITISFQSVRAALSDPVKALRNE